MGTVAMSLYIGRENVDMRQKAVVPALRQVLSCCLFAQVAFDDLREFSVRSETEENTLKETGIFYFFKKTWLLKVFSKSFSTLKHRWLQNRRSPRYGSHGVYAMVRSFLLPKCVLLSPEVPSLVLPNAERFGEGAVYEDGGVSGEYDVTSR